MPGHVDFSGFGYCLRYRDDQVVDRLIERLEEEGIFKEEELPPFVLVVRDTECRNHWLILSDGEFGPGEIKSPLPKYREDDRARVLARLFGLDREGVQWSWGFGKGWTEAHIKEHLKELVTET